MFQSDVNFWLTFLCVVVAVPALLVMAAHYVSRNSQSHFNAYFVSTNKPCFDPRNLLLLQANILACSVLGAFAIISPVDHYIGSNLKYIVINTIRRATIRDFRTAVIDPPFQTRGGLTSPPYLAYKSGFSFAR